MGTKNDPGDFDAYEAADPNEPMFVLIGRDADAPDLVERWADIREEKGENPSKVAEARQCAAQMRLWHTTRRTFALAIAETLGMLHEALLTPGELQKQWFLREIAKTLGGSVPEEAAQGVEPRQGT